MNKYFRYILFLVCCIVLAGCSKRNEDFTALDDVLDDTVQEEQVVQEAYWKKEIAVNGTNVSQIVIDAKISRMRTDSLCEVTLSRRNLDAGYAEETVAGLMDSYEKEDTEPEEGISYTGYWNNVPCEFRVYDTGVQFFLSDYKDGLSHFPEGEWESAVPRWSEVSYRTEENSSTLSPKEAEQIGNGFLEKLGLDTYGLAKIEDLYWEPQEEMSDDGEVIVNGGTLPENTWCEGYALTYARDIAGTLQDVEGYWYTTAEAQMRIGHEYNRNLEGITLYVTDFGVVYAYAFDLCDGETHAIEGQQVLDAEAAEKKFEEILMGEPNRFSNVLSGNRLEFNALDLVYYADAPNHISPVWRLSNLAKPNWEAIEGGEVYQQVILIDAVSGKEIDPQTEAFYPYEEETYYEYNAKPEP